MRLSAYSVVVTLALLATVYKARPQHPAGSIHRTEVQNAAEGAYRDGLYVGRLQREKGLAARPSIGRWNGEADRRLFVEGYRRGYEGRMD